MAEQKDPTALNTFRPEGALSFSEVGRQGTFFQYDPSMGDVVGAYMHEAWQGTGTLNEALDAAQIEFEKGEMSVKGPVSLYNYIEKKLLKAEPSRKMEFEEWKQSGYYREGLKWDDKMTETMAQIMAEHHDREFRNTFIIGQASGAEKVLGITGAFAGGIFEPRNLGTGVGAALTLGGVHGMVTSRAAGVVKQTQNAKKMADKVKKAKKTKKQLDKVIGKGGSVKRAGVEGLIGSAVLEPGNWANADTLNKDYGMSDAMWNVLLSIGASTLIQAGVNKLGQKSHRIKTQQEAVDASLVAISQVSQGKKVETATQVVNDYHEAVAESLDPPRGVDPKELVEAAEQSGTTGIDPYFLEEARQLRESLDSGLYGFDRNNNKEVANVLGLKSITSLKQDIIRLGGLIDDGGDFAARGIKSGRKGVPPGLMRRSKQQLHEAGKGDLSKAGMGFDDMITRLKELGYFADKEDVSKSDLINLLEDDVNGVRQYPDDIMARLNDLDSATDDRLLADAGIGVGDDVETIAKALQKYYAEENIPFGKENPQFIPERTRQTPDELINAYERDYEEWRDIDLYDDVDPNTYNARADELSDVSNELNEIESHIAEMEQEIEDMRSGDMLDDDTLGEIETIEERVAIMDEARIALKQGMVCLTRF